MHDDRHIISLRKLPPQEPPRIVEPVVFKKKSRAPLYIVLGLVLVVALVGSFVMFGASQSLNFSNTATTTTSITHTTNEAGDLVQEVGKIVLLPNGEVPTIATIVDPSKYSGQAFFKNAKTGDKVLIYVEAKKAYLYRPSQNLLIEAAPITPEAQ
jgi:hypothetical protein